MDLRPPEGLVGIDVANARDDALVEQAALDGAVPRLEPLDDGPPVVSGLEGVGRDVGDRVGDPVGIELRQSHPAEGPLIHEAQLRPVVGEVEPRMRCPMPKKVGLP